MKIVKLKMKNFRGYHGEKEINFDGTPFVLLSAPNGSGKTSVIDAIEWCLTGSIGRLKEAYDNRSTNSNERKKNWDGILKNKNAGKKEYVEVELTYSDQDQIFCLSRKQKNDDLNSENSEVFLNGNSASAQTELERIVNKSFYNYHFCDVQKSFGIQSKQRKELPELFTEFITDYSRETAVAHNLEVFAADVERYKTDLSEEKIDSSQIENLEKKLKEYEKAPEIVSYPQEALYSDEELDITQMDEVALNEQLHQLYLCGYSVAETYLNKLVNDRYDCDTISKLEDLRKSFEKHQEEVGLSIKYNLYKDNSELEAISDKIQKYETIHLNAKNIRQNSELLLNFKSESFTKIFYEKTINEIDQNEKRLNELEKDIKHMTEGNIILSVFTEMLSQKEGIIKFREESEKCPVCGSTQFGELSDLQILSDAEKYINSNNSLVAEKNMEKVKTEQSIQSKYKALIEVANKVLNEELENQKSKLIQFETLRDNTKSYFSLANQIVIRRGIECTVEELKSIDYIQSKIDILKNHLLPEEEINNSRNSYQNILNLLGYKFADEEESTTAIKINERAKGCPEIIKFDYLLFVQRINAINSVKNSKEYLESTRTLNQYKKLNSEIEKKQNQLESLYDKAIQRSKKILRLVEQLKKKEYDSVGPDLQKYYKKLARIDSIATINIVFEEDQISIIDENGKNLVNILSNGQLGVFMLAYFFAGITKRSENECFKVYFIDDLTACMDDVNMLSFLDLLKYQMMERKNMEQIFFLTCDDRICRLLKYKLDGCGVKYCEIGEHKLCAI